jgi:hypothetical protein
VILPPKDMLFNACFQERRAWLVPGGNWEALDFRNGVVLSSLMLRGCLFLTGRSKYRTAFD